MAPTDFLNAGLSQAFHLFKKKKKAVYVRCNKTRIPVGPKE